MIELNNIKKIYSNTLILDIKNFRFEREKSYLLVGSNGCGKSTLIKCILKINKLNEGIVKINCDNIGYVPERYYFPDLGTINSYLINVCKIYGISNIENMINYYCNIFSINKDLKLNKLSKGMSQKVLIIQSVIHDAKLLIFDEPINGLDFNSQKIFFNLIKSLRNKGKTIIITTHYPSFYKDMYDYYIVMKDRGIYFENI